MNALRAKYPDVTFERIDIGAEIPPAGTFDWISCMDVLFHIVDDAKYARAIENIARLLNPGGVFVFTENCLPKRPLNNAFQNSRTLAEIERLLKDNGLAIVQRRPMFALMNATALMLCFARIGKRCTQALPVRKPSVGSSARCSISRSVSSRRY